MRPRTVVPLPARELADLLCGRMRGLLVAIGHGDVLRGVVLGLSGEDPGWRRLPAAVVVLAASLVWPAAAAANFVTELTGGVTPGFSANGGPSQVTAGPDGRIWFTESVDPGRVARVNADGTVTELTGGATPGFSANGSPSGITTGPDGHIWFTEATNPGRVARVNGNGTVTEFTGGVTSGFSANVAPDAITTGPDGHIWFAEAHGGVGRLNDDGTVTELKQGVTPGFKGSLIFGITAGPDGHIWFTEELDPGGLGRVNGDGTVTEFTGGVTTGFSANGGPTGITSGPDGNIWFTEAANPGRVARFYVGLGSVQEFTGGVAPGFSVNGRPNGITSGSNGDIWFTESAIDRFAFVHANGTVTEEQSGAGGFTGSFPFGITTGSDGDIWFTELIDPGHVARVGPRAVTGAASSIGQSSVTLNGTLNPGGLTISDCHFEYGTTTAYGATAPCAQTVGPGSNPVAVSANVIGLAPTTTYHFRLIGVNGFATSRGADQTFTTLAPPAPGAPLVTTGLASAITQTTAMLNGTVNPQGSATTYHFEYGTSTAYGDGAPIPEAGGGSDHVTHAVAQPIAGLAPGTTYHFRIVATNRAGTTVGADETLTTRAPNPLVRPPSLSGLMLTPSRFRAARRGGSIAAAKPPPTGTKISYRDSSRATTRFTVGRAGVGVRVGRRCVRRRGPRPKRAKSCRLLIVLGSFMHTDKLGANSFRFTGRVSGRKLSPGTYTLAAIASNAGGSSKRLTAHFAILQ